MTNAIIIVKITFCNLVFGIIKASFSYINAGAVKAIHSQQAVSILPVGVTRIEGDFEKDDIVRIIDPDGNSIGVGRIAFDSETAREFIGHQGAKPFVHYDYLYLD